MKRRLDGLGFNLQVARSYEAMSRSAARLVVAALQTKPDLLFCASSGGTPTRLYQLLAAEHSRNPRLFRRMRVLQVDEWSGLPPSHPATCETDLRNKLLDPLEIAENRYVGFRSNAANRE